MFPLQKMWTSCMTDTKCTTGGMKPENDIKKLQVKENTSKIVSCTKWNQRISTGTEELNFALVIKSFLWEWIFVDYNGWNCACEKIFY